MTQPQTSGAATPAPRAPSTELITREFLAFYRSLHTVLG